MTKGFGSQKSPDFTKRQKAYFKLIKQLLNCPSGQERKVFRKHPHLVDSGLVDTLLMVSKIRINEGDIRSAYFLQNVANWLAQELGLDRDEPHTFLAEILMAIAQNQGNREGIYPLLKANLHQLNQAFYEQFHDWINFTLLNTNLNREAVMQVGLGVIDLCVLLWQFPLGDRAINLEIAITGLEGVANIFTPEISPEIWAQIQVNLVPAYRHRIRGNRADNQEKAIIAGNNAQSVYTRAAFTEKWARVQNNLGLVYTDRITGDKTDNIEKSISCYETALKVVNRPELPELWGTIQNNLGNAYLNRIEGDKAQNLEKAIACYQVALQVRTRSISPYYWASSQHNLANAYTARILGNKQQNLQKAIAAYLNALEVYNISDFPERWAATTSSLGNAYYQASQLTEALECCRAALQFLTPTNFPRDCLQTGLILAKVALATDLKAEILRGYEIALEAVEQIRLWGGISHLKEIPAAIEAYIGIVVFFLTNGERDKAKNYAKRSNLPEILDLVDDEQFAEIYSNLQFLGQVLQVTAENNGEATAVYQILENNLDKLDEQFVQNLQRLENLLKHIPSGQAIQFAANLVSFSSLIGYFSQGDLAINFKIAVTGYEVAANVFTKQDFPEQWGTIQNALRELFQIQLWEAVSINRENYKNVYPLLEANQDKLDERFATVLRLKMEAMLSQLSPEEAKGCAAILAGFSYLILGFPQGNEANNLEIALTGYEIASQILNEETFPEQSIVCQVGLGCVYHRRIKGEQAENLEKSLSYLHNALQICNREHFPQMWAEIHNNLLITYGYRIRGDQAENAKLAIESGEAAMEVYTRNQYPERWGAIQNNLGLIYKDMVTGDQVQNLEKAIACFQNALLVRQREEFPELWAQTQLNIGSAYRQRLKGDAAENLEKAISANLAALQVYTKEAFPLDWAKVQMNLANAYLERLQGDKRKNLEKAIAAHQAALQVFTKEEFPRQWAMGQMNLGNVFSQQEQEEAAITCYRSALKIFRPTAFPLYCLRTGQMLGNIAFKIGDWAEAIKGYGVAIEAVETSRTWANSELRRQEILANSLHIYQNMVQACLNNKQLDKAVEYVERSRSKRLVDLIASNDFYSDAEIPLILQKYLQDFEAIQQQIDKQRGYINNNFDNNTRAKIRQDRAALKADNEIIANLEADKQQIWEQIRYLDPVQAGQIQVNIMKLSSIQQLIDLPTTAILSFYITSFDTHIFIIRQNQINLHTCTGLGLPTLQESILIHWLGQYVNNQDTWKEQFHLLTSELAEVLNLNDLIAQYLQNISELIVIPHLALHQIPFAALPIAESQYLGDKFLIRYVPSCQILEFCHNRTSIDSNLKYGIVEDATEDLPYANWEGEQLVTLYDIPNHQHLKGSQQASVSGYRELLQQVQVIHSSHHAQSRLDNPLESALILADGRITLGQLLTPAWRNPQLKYVFLSCCETGLGIPEITDDILTLSTGFICAGAKSVISTLWSVDDLATALFSLFYYQHSSQGNKQLESIKKAQFQLRNLTGETLRKNYQPTLNDFLTQKLKERSGLCKQTKQKRDLYQPASPMYQQLAEEYKKHDQIGKGIYRAKQNLEFFCRESKPFSHPVYWAAFIYQG